MHQYQIINCYLMLDNLLWDAGKKSLLIVFLVVICHMGCTILCVVSHWIRVICWYNQSWFHFSFSRLLWLRCTRMYSLSETGNAFLSWKVRIIYHFLWIVSRSCLDPCPIVYFNYLRACITSEQCMQELKRWIPCAAFMVFRREDRCEAKHDVGVERENLSQKIWLGGGGG